MNIFFLSWIPSACAACYGDQHVNKILIEIVQMLYGAHWSSMSGDVSWLPLSVPEGLDVRHPYRATHSRHPMAVWVRACRANYEWAVELALALAAEYSKRFGQKTHKCEYNALWLWYHVPPLPDPSQTPTVPPFCAGQYAKDYADSTASHMDIVTAYRRYYTDEKLQLVLYRHSRVPYFIERYLRKQKRSVEFLRRQISRKKRQRTA